LTFVVEKKREEVECHMVAKVWAGPVQEGGLCILYSLYKGRVCVRKRDILLVLFSPILVPPPLLNPGAYNIWNYFFFLFHFVF
jgi:hypothetical protein